MSKIQLQVIANVQEKQLFVVRPLSSQKSIIPPSKSFLLYKRAFDLVMSILVIVLVLSWLIPILAILIKIDSKGPVFFVQKRVGTRGRIFRCFKLRTMYMNRHANILQARENDPRITSLGKFLRKSCLDELPQFLNVLFGQMSIVGPRPHMLNDCKEFSRLIKDYDSRSLVKPGITGMAQVKGCRGHVNDLYDALHRYKWDMFYVKNCNFHLDMSIMKSTIYSLVASTFKGLVPAKKEQETIPFNLDRTEYLN